MLTPSDILNKEFKRGFRGYDEQEVNDFLDEIVSEFEKLQRENEQLRGELELHKQGLVKYQQMEKNLQDTLMVAQQTADEVIKTARQRSEEMKDAVEQECRNQKKQAEIEIKTQLAEITTQIQQQQAHYEAMVLQERQFVVKMRALMRTELELLEDEGVRQALGGGIEEQTGESVEEKPQLEEKNVDSQPQMVERDIRVLAEQRRAQQAKEEAEKEAERAAEQNGQ